MRPDDDAERLLAKARNCRDNADAEALVVAAFEEQYLAGLSLRPETASPETHARSMELYDFVIGGKRRQKDFTANAELFERAAATIRQGEQ